jgi:kynureninase
VSAASYKAHFARFLGADPQRLHLCAHSHHPWPDVSFTAHMQAWLDATRWMDAKWEHVFGELIPRAQAHLARLLALSDPGTIAFAPTTHELVLRLLSCVERRPVRVLTSDAEFHSFARQLRRLEEAGLASAEVVSVEPFADFAERFAAACARGGHDLVYFSQCFFNSGLLLTELARLVRAVPERQTLIVIDGYHGFMAVPTALTALADRAFYVAGGYKYAMSGEGCCFMHCPPGYAPRPVNTGWFAGFAALSRGAQDIPYGPGGQRFMGATYDPVGLYRLVAVMDWLAAQALDPALIHAHVQALQRRFLEGLEALRLEALAPQRLIPPPGVPRGNFLTFRHPQAAALHERLAAQRVVTDYRADRLRLGFGIYHDACDVDELLVRCARALS